MPHQYVEYWGTVPAPFRMCQPEWGIRCFGGTRACPKCTESCHVCQGQERVNVDPRQGHFADHPLLFGGVPLPDDPTTEEVAKAWVAQVTAAMRRLNPTLDDEGLSHALYHPDLLYPEVSSVSVTPNNPTFPLMTDLPNQALITQEEYRETIARHLPALINLGLVIPAANYVASGATPGAPTTTTTITSGPETSGQDLPAATPAPVPAIPKWRNPKGFPVTKVVKLLLSPHLGYLFCPITNVYKLDVPFVYQVCPEMAQVMYWDIGKRRVVLHRKSSLSKRGVDMGLPQIYMDFLRCDNGMEAYEFIIDKESLDEGLEKLERKRAEKSAKKISRKKK